MELRRVLASARGRRRLRQRLAAQLGSYWKTKLSLLWQTARSNHTIVNAIAPPEEDILGSTLQDEQVIHIFWSTFLVELLLSFLISDENEGDFNLIATMYVGLLCSLIGGFAAKIQAASFTFCNKKRRYQTWLDRLPARIQKWRKRRRRIRRLKAVRALPSTSATVQVSPPRIQPKREMTVRARLPSPPPSPPNPDREQVLALSDSGAAKVGTIGRSVDKTKAGSSAMHRARWQRAGSFTAALRSKREMLNDEEKAVATKEAERRKRMTLIPFSRSYVIFRWWCGWLFNLIFYVLLCAVNFIYGVQTGSVQFGQVMLAWLAALIFTYLVVEPAEIFGIVFLPAIAENKYVMWCQDRAKYYGLY